MWGEVMTPTKNIASDATQVSEMCVDEKQGSTFELNVEGVKGFSCIVDSLEDEKKLNLSVNKPFYTDSTIETCKALNSDLDENESVVKCASIANPFEDSHNFSNSIMSSEVGMVCSKSLKNNYFAQHSGYIMKTVSELEECSLKELQVLLEDLTQTVEAVSSELVQLLLENDSLTQETDARNVAIEQLLKMTVKNTDNELKPIQMSVILPSDESDNIVSES